VFADRHQLREMLSAYAEHRLSGPLVSRLAPASWNLAVKTLSAFYSWAAAEGHADAVPFSYIQQVITRPDGARVEITRNLATIRTGNPHAGRKYLERPYTELLMNALTGNDPVGHAIRCSPAGRPAVMPRSSGWRWPVGYGWGSSLT